MKAIVFVAGLFALLFAHQLTYSQSYSNLEFVENKGQWDEKVKFKGEMSTGAFFLKNNGYTVVQHNTEDLKKLAGYYHASGNSGATDPHGHTDPHANAGSQLKVPASPNNVTVRSHAYNVSFLNSATPKIVVDKPLNNYNNYFIGNDPKKWGTNCKIFQAITYQNVYPNVDVRYYTNNGKLKYDIIVRPGADINRIAMHYDGVEGLNIKNEELLIKTSVGEMRELSPYSYQLEAGKRKQVGCRFKVSGNIVQFKVDSYQKNSTLVIDPTLIFSTFTGSTADNWGYTATYGPDGSFYAGGIVFGSGFPTNNGAFQTTYGGGLNEGSLPGHDIGIMKFDPTGSNRVYATYIGGSANEQPHSLVVNGNNELVISGRTSSTNYPTTSSTFGLGGGYDIILTKLNSTGNGLIGSRKIGGTKEDGVNILPKTTGGGAISIRRNYGDDARSEVILDNNNNIYLASCTQSTDYPVTASAFQRTSGGVANSRAQDGVLIKTSSDITNILFSSYLGGNKDDAAFVLSINPSNNNIYVGGSTVSTNFPGSTAGPAIHSSFQGGECDGFVAIVSNDGSTLIKSTYIGGTGNDMLYGVQFDQFAFPYVMGTTNVSLPVIQAPNTTTFFSQQGGKQFVSKLKPDLSGYEFSTNFGTNSSAPNISPTAFLVDRCQRMYVSGWGGATNTQGTSSYPNSGTNGLTVTSDAIQTNTDGSDFYFIVLERNATSQLYGSFWGQIGGFGEHVDGGTSRFDRQGVIYQALCANCQGGANYPTTPGVWAPNNGSKSCNLAALKVAFNLSGVVGSIRPSINGVTDSSGCIPMTVEFTDTLGLGKKYIWNFGDGSPDTTTMGPSAKHTYFNIGTYTVRLVAIDSTTCNIADTVYATVQARNDEAFLSFTHRKVGPCESFGYEFTNTSIPPAGKPFKANSFIWDFGDNTPRVTAGAGIVNHTYATPGTYKVKLVLVDTNYCNAPDSITIDLRIASNVDARFETPPSGCAPHNAVFKNTSLAGQQFLWDFGDGTTSTQSDPSHLYTTPGTYAVKLTVIDSATCNIIDSTSSTIIVSDKPTAAFTFAPVVPQENTPVVFTNSSIGAIHYKWVFGDGDSLITTSTAPVSHIYNATGKFNTCLIATNQFGCRDTVCQLVEAKIVPALDVPNAFTPNGDGVNDRVFVRGFGIARMVWRIYNRWGTLIYQSASQKEGWDGTYKGVIQPKEVYHYVLDVQFSDKTTHQKKGDITLL